MKHEKKKIPSDYPIFAFRLTTKQEKEALQVLVDEVHRLTNRGIGKDVRPLRKNEIIVEALEKGLRQMKGTLQRK